MVVFSIQYLWPSILMNIIIIGDICERRVKSKKASEKTSPWRYFLTYRENIWLSVAFSG